jgi:hypothetical protein
LRRPVAVKVVRLGEPISLDREVPVLDRWTAYLSMRAPPVRSGARQVSFTLRLAGVALGERGAVGLVGAALSWPVETVGARSGTARVPASARPVDAVARTTVVAARAVYAPRRKRLRRCMEATMTAGRTSVMSSRHSMCRIPQ